MKSGDSVTELGRYSSDCCRFEMIFDTGDRFWSCPDCDRNCIWELEEDIVTQEEFERISGVAA